MIAKRLIIFLSIVLILLLIGYYWPSPTGKSIADSSAGYARETVFVTRIIDGDTIVGRLGDTLQTYRLLGINTPEKNKPYYSEAKNFLYEIENKSIEILRDGDDFDRYDRRLRYVFYNNRLMNVESVQLGLATTFMLDELKYKDKFVNAEKFARASGIGLWEKSKDVCAGCVNLVSINAEEDYFIIKNKCDFDCNLTDWLVKDDANHFFKLNDLKSLDEEKYDSLIIFKAEVWNDAGDRFFMRDKTGRLVLFYEY